ncbi:MAG: VCBS repeat-containing protein [Candidatus Kapaibacterium sp.]
MNINQERAINLSAAVIMMLLLVGTMVYAQPASTVTRNPNAKLLRRIWTMTGKQRDENAGYGIGSLGDIFGTGYSAWAAYGGISGQWRVFKGDSGTLSTTPVWVFDSSSGMTRHPLVGDFWGTGHKAVGFSKYTIDTLRGSTNFPYVLYLFRSEYNRLDTIPSLILDPRKMPAHAFVGISDAQAVDLDGDGADELILYNIGVIRNGSVDRHPEIWIYRGGPHFQVDTPTVILHDGDINGGSDYDHMFIGNWDGDGRPDIAVVDDYNDGKNPAIKFWFSKDGSPWSWNYPDRVVPQRRTTALFAKALDCDGDGILDLALPAPGQRIVLYRSSAGKDYHTRILDTNDADGVYQFSSLSDLEQLGFINDKGRRYGMLGAYVPSPGGSAMLLGFGGGANGPDAQYDCYYAAEFDPVGGIGGYYVLGMAQSAGDVNGDGWDDVLEGSFQYNNYAGIAIILAGGPEIPRDASAGVEIIAGEGHFSAISVWPLPARDEVHIAWRGDLRRMPERFEVHDISGRSVARGVVESWRGEALWECGNLAAGAYILSMYDSDGVLIATKEVLKSQ